MIAYLQGKDVTVDVPDDIGDKELGDMAKSFSPNVDSSMPTVNHEPGISSGISPRISPDSTPSTQPKSAPASNSWVPNFYASYIKPYLGALGPLGLPGQIEGVEPGTLEKGADLAGEAINKIPAAAGPLALPGELGSTPETRAFTGAAINAYSLGLTKPVLNPLLDEDIQNHPVYATAGRLTGDLGSLLTTGNLLKVAGLGAEATEVGAKAAKYVASAPRFLPRAIMTGATFGTKTFFEKTIKAFQDGGVDPAEFGKAVLLQSVGGAAFGAIGGVANMPTAVAAAAGTMFTMSKMEGGSNAEAGLSAAVAGAFEMVGSFGRSEELNREALKTVADSISNYARSQNPTLAPEMADAMGAAIVEREAAKFGGVDAIVKGETGKENTLQTLEEINQRIRQGKVRPPMQEVKPQPQIETAAAGTSETSQPSAPSPAAPTDPSEPLPAPETVAQGQTGPVSTELNPPAPGNVVGQIREESPNTIFPPTEVSSLPSISEHPDYIKMTNDATAVVKHYAEERGVEPTRDFATNLWKEMHDAMGEIMKAPASGRLALKKQIDEKYLDIEREFLTLRDKLWSDRTDGFFQHSVVGRYGHLRPKLGIEAEDNVLRGTLSPTEKPTEIAPETAAKKVKVDEQGLPVRKPGSVVSTVELLDGQKAKITHQMILDESDALLSDAHDKRGTAGALEKFVLENGKLKSYQADETGAVPEAEEMRDVPVRFKGGEHNADEMAQMAYDRGLLPEPDADLLRTELKTIPVRGQSPKLADFYDQAQRNLEQYFSNLGKPQEEQLPDWLTQDQGTTDEMAAEKRASYGPVPEIPKFKNTNDAFAFGEKHAGNQALADALDAKMADMDPQIEEAGKNRAIQKGINLATERQFYREAKQKIEAGLTTQMKAAQPAYHGSPYKFDKFELQKIGSGEGAQSYGWGLYFAGKKDVAQYYQQKLSRRTYEYKGKPIEFSPFSSLSNTPESYAAKAIDLYKEPIGFLKEAAEGKMPLLFPNTEIAKKAIKIIESGEIKSTTGSLYHVDIPEDTDMLNWDKPLSKQPAGVKKALENSYYLEHFLQYPENSMESTGADFYEWTIGSEDSETRKEDAMNLSQSLANKGIAGIKYLDQGSRGSGEGTHNYVVFDDSRVKVLQVEEPQASPYQQEFDFERVINPKSKQVPATELLPVQPTVRGGFRALMKPHLEVEFKKTGAVMIPNRTIDSPADLAYAFKQLHNEAQENFFLGAIKNNRIVAVEHMGFGTIDQVAVYPFETINLIDKNAADGFFIVHNHPSGQVEPSHEDKNLTSAIKSIMEKNGVEFKGHVIIDDTKFGFIAPDGTVSTETHKEYEKTQELPILKKHFEWQRSKSSIAEGPVLNSPQKAFELFKGIQKSDDEGALYLMDTQNRILNAVVLPKNQFNVGTIQRLAAAYRAAGVLTVNSGLDDFAYKRLGLDLKPASIKLLDDLSVQPGTNAYQSKLERLGEERANFLAAKEKAGDYNPLPDNPAEKYSDLIKQAKERGLSPREARAWAKEQILGNGQEPTVFPPTREAPIGGLKDTIESIKEAGGEIRDLVAPAKSAPLAGEFLRENLAKIARSYDKAEKALESGSKFFDTRSAAQNTDFIDKMEHGEEQSTQELDSIAKSLRKLFDDKRGEVQALGTGKLQSFIENYFPHIWDQSPKVVSKATMKAAKRPLEGSKAFLKKRTVEYFKDGIKLGLTPVSYNPIELTLLKMREMDKYIAAHSTLNSLKEEGLAKFVRIGDKAPEDFQKLDDKISTVMRKTDEGLVITGHYYVQSDAARLINNYLKPGLQKFALYRGYRYAGNLMNQFQLGFSAFHLGFTSMDAIVSKAALAINQLALGHPLRAIANVIRSPIAPLENILRGDKVMKAWYGDGEFAKGTEEVMAQALTAAGGRVRMDPFYATKAWDQMQKYFRMGAPIRGLLHVPIALTELTSKPILEYIVPRQKLGIFADIMRMEMEHNPNLTHEELRTLAQRAWDSVDNRMGQLVYDNLFWDKTFKDLLMGSVRSVGWNLGTIRELGGGALDVAQIPLKMAKGDPHSVSYRAAYFFALPIITGLFGAIYQYLRTGKGPETLKDYYFPRTGGSDQFGMPNRVSLPSYMKDLYHYKEAPVQTVLNKLNPLLAMVVQMYHNKDFFGVKIRNEDDPFVRQIISEAAYILKQSEPFGLHNMQRNIQTGNKSLSDIVEPWIGVTPAPYDVNQTKAEKLAHFISAEKVAIGGRTQAQADHSALLRQLGNNFRAKVPGAAKAMQNAFHAGQISTNDMTRLIREQRMTPIQRLTHNFSAEELQRVYNVATPEEKAQLERDLRMKDIRHKSHYALTKS